ncbi:hypothetical protein TSTA_020570 [Talaromyces stipitatus ATCC 10500]|uniref:Myb-like domain-containing protein n=1 Tax=Talaromyces stipitatus (strain ATCC 10500 / CBS 375.48 / QM 6759 / NRRL 1006) TaxID=441959 RepID=B8MFL0_TALSN|nr:uncharacterized protein TSTA_020570 [Talaromyces stipitatus ATCC 10500]EED17000.1 hypothetical protein TSTA_020570 [Talaromyces stipitatus ATCC 10500]
MRRFSPSSQEGSPSLTLSGQDCDLAEITNGFIRGGPLDISPPSSPDLFRSLLREPFIVEMDSPHQNGSPFNATKRAKLGKQRPLNESGANHSSSWSYHDDTVLISARAGGQGWSQIQREHFPNKTANACRKRHERLVAKRRGTEWNQEMLEKLSTEYSRRREQIWQPLANAIGEKWQDVEKACFEKGLKSLITQPRTSRRRDDVLHTQVQPGIVSKSSSDEYPRRTSLLPLKDILAPD